MKMLVQMLIVHVCILFKPFIVARVPHQNYGCVLLHDAARDDTRLHYSTLTVDRQSGGVYSVATNLCVTLVPPE